MKTQIEYSIAEKNFRMINRIIDTCISAKDEEQLRYYMHDEYETNSVKFGFGHNHFWLSQISPTGTVVRTLFIDFEKQ